MPIDLTKGQRVDLTKTNPSVSVYSTGCGWDVNRASGAQFDLDLFIVCLDRNNKNPEGEICYFGKKELFSGAIKHSGDNLTGAGDGDDEVVSFKFDKIPGHVFKMVVCVNIYQGKSRKQNFGQVSNAYIRILGDNVELMKYNLSEDGSTFEGMVLGELYKVEESGEWKFAALSKGFNGDINQMVEQFYA